MTKPKRKHVRAPLPLYPKRDWKKARHTVAAVAVRNKWSREELREILEILGLLEYNPGRHIRTLHIESKWVNET